MKNQPLISILIPVYNVEEYLRECVDSVINQTYENLEIILVDDGSTDSSGKICDEYAEKDSRVIVVHKTNSGPSKTRNEGLKVAKGDYIYFLDSDDYIDNNTIEILVLTAQNHDADLVFFSAECFCDDGFEVKQGYTIKNTYKSCNGYEMLTQLHKNKDYHCSVVLLLIKHSILTENNISFLETAYCSEDMLFTYKIFCSAKNAVHCPQSLYFRRCRPNSIVTSNKNELHFRSCRDVYEEIRDYSERISKTGDYMATEYTVRCAFNALETYKKIPKEKQSLCKMEYKSLKKDILLHSAFNNTTLKMRCYGKVFWFVYKIFEKTVGRLLKG